MTIARPNEDKSCGSESEISELVRIETLVCSTYYSGTSDNVRLQLKTANQNIGLQMIAANQNTGLQLKTANQNTGLQMIIANQNTGLQLETANENTLLQKPSTNQKTCSTDWFSGSVERGQIQNWPASLLSPCQGLEPTDSLEFRFELDTWGANVHSDELQLCRVEVEFTDSGWVWEGGMWNSQFHSVYNSTSQWRGLARRWTVPAAANWHRDASYLVGLITAIVLIM